MEPEVLADSVSTTLATLQERSVPMFSIPSGRSRDEETAPAGSEGQDSGSALPSVATTAHPAHDSRKAGFSPGRSESRMRQGATFSPEPGVSSTSPEERQPSFAAARAGAATPTAIAGGKGASFERPSPVQDPSPVVGPSSTEPRESRASTDLAAGNQSVSEKTNIPPASAAPGSSAFGQARFAARSRQAEKLSLVPRDLPTVGEPRRGDSEKDILPADATLVEKATFIVGTATAKAVTHMPSTLSAHEPAAFATEMATTSGLVESGADAGATATVAFSAHEAVESVLSLTERIGSGDSQSVNLRFSIGDNDLHVRVGYRGDEVQTTFVTESPELRAALMQEWQAMGAPAAERAPLRFADPVFTSAGQNDASFTASDSSAQQQQHSAARRDSSATAETGRQRLPGGEPSAPSTLPPVRVFEPAASSSRLHTFA